MWGHVFQLNVGVVLQQNDAEGLLGPKPTKTTRPEPSPSAFSPDTPFPSPHVAIPLGLQNPLPNCCQPHACPSHCPPVPSIFPSTGIALSSFASTMPILPTSINSPPAPSNFPLMPSTFSSTYPLNLPRFDIWRSRSSSSDWGKTLHWIYDLTIVHVYGHCS